MKSFYPGPSTLFPEVKNYLADIYDSGILSVNHRSAEFVELSKSCIGLLKDKLNIPADYTIFFTSSATECWEIIAQSLIKEQSVHIYNGAFGEKWADYTAEIIGEYSCKRVSFNVNEILDISTLNQYANTNLLALTHNETSNATCLPEGFIEKVKASLPSPLIAIDATSSMAGVALPFASADIWFASVQKCFGLPAGLAIMACSPRVRERCSNSNRYNSLAAMFERMDSWQTTYTPNVLAIALLKKVLEGRNWEDTILKNRAQKLYEFFEQNPQLGTLLVTETKVQSQTVIAVQHTEEFISAIKAKAKANGFLLGNGYGKWSKNTFRIANFPAIDDQDYQLLKDFFIQNQSI